MKTLADKLGLIYYHVIANVDLTARKHYTGILWWYQTNKMIVCLVEKAFK